MLTDTAAPTCAQDDGSICSTVWDATHNGFLARTTDAVATHGGRIILIVVVALIFRYLTHRAINRLTRVTADGDVPAALRPLKDRTAVRFREGSVRMSERRRQRAETIGSVLRSAASVITFTVAAILVLGELGINLGPIIAGAGVAGIAIGLGARAMVEDFLAGMFMILEDQYGVGDRIDVGDVTAIVEAVGLRATVLKDEHGAVWYIRNGQIARVANMSQGNACVLLDVPVPHTADLSRAGEAILEAARSVAAADEWSDVITSEPELLGIQSITADNSVLRLSIQTRAGSQYRLQRQLMARMRERFAAESLPPPAIT